jgi:diadenosine tetraphosphatase ApaH/serine/threonine PP2A family protein phosphatase
VSDVDDSDEEIEINLRSAAEVARRFIIVNSVIRRIVIDSTLDSDAFGLAFDIREWLRAEDLWNDATADEQAILSTPPGGFGPDDVADLSLHAEGLAILGWTLSMIDSPTVDELSNILSEEDRVPGPWQKTAPWVAAQSMRSEPIIAFARELAELWSWRYQIEPFRRMAEGRDLMEIERTIRDVTHEGTTTGLLEPGKKGGFQVGGIPVTRMDPFEIDELLALQTERLMALNWICGYGEDWDSVPLEI